MSRRAVSMQDLPTAGRWAIYIAIALLFAVACAFLSHWQFSRNEERAQQLTLVEENYDPAPVALADLIPPGGELDSGDHWRPVRLVGSYISEDLLLVRNRPRGGTSAYEVLVPFRLNDGRVLIVDRGWVPPGDDGPLPETIPAAPDGEVTVIARLRPGEPLPASGRSADEGQVPTINLPLIADTVAPLTAAQLETSAYGIMATEEPARGERPNPLQPPSEDPGPYLSYAIQWILFAVMGFVFIGYVIRAERRHRLEGDPSDPDDQVEERSRRRDRDAADEDALIDAAGH